MSTVCDAAGMDGTDVPEPDEVFFESDGVRCAADLYRPATVDTQLPCVVMGNGGSGTKRLGLPKYAEKFVAAGLGVLAFDYRCFGLSGGEPRQVIDVAKQLDDYRSAVRYARSREEISSVEADFLQRNCSSAPRDENHAHT